VVRAQRSPKDHDSIHENKVLDGNETAVFEDSAYINKEKASRKPRILHIIAQTDTPERRSDGDFFRGSF